MRGLIVATGLTTMLAAGLASGAARAEEPIYVTVRDHLMCRTQLALRDALHAIDTKDKFLMSTIDGCHYSIDGIPAIVLQDNISRIKIRLSADGQRADMWTVPETIKPMRREEPAD
jgi:hypothetical protein